MSTDPKSTYYDAGGIETIDVIRAKLTFEQFKGYLLGNSIKYSCRLSHKGEEERDSEKLEVYAKLLRDQLASEALSDEKISDNMSKILAWYKEAKTEPGRGALEWPEPDDPIYCDNTPSDMEPDL